MLMRCLAEAAVFQVDMGWEEKPIVVKRHSAFGELGFSWRGWSAEQMVWGWSKQYEGIGRLGQPTGLQLPQTWGFILQEAESHEIICSRGEARSELCFWWIPWVSCGDGWKGKLRQWGAHGSDPGES